MLRTFRAAALIAVVLAVAARPLHAHFLWLVATQPDGGGTRYEIYFGESADPDDPALLKRLGQVEGVAITSAGEARLLEFRLADEALTASRAEGDAEAIAVVSHRYGVVARGGAPFLLNYAAKHGPPLGSPAWAAVDCRERLALDVTPAVVEGGARLSVTFQGKPAAGVQVVVLTPKFEEIEGVTDQHGVYTLAAAEPGIYDVRARHVSAEKGEHDGQPYEESRHYTTIALTVGEPTPLALPDLPELVTSFGAAISNGALYVYGGHTGGAHSYSHAEQAHTLRRLELRQGAKWESLAEGPHLQGLAMVAHGGDLYRLGGFTARNQEGDDHDLWSTDAVARFDVAHRAWVDLPPLPEPRSSFDAAVLDGQIYVVGGWALRGADDSQWHATAHVLDLGQEPLAWRPLPEPPFRRRALAVAAHRGRLYAIGGMQEKGGPCTDVTVFDPETGKWTSGPNILGEPMEGFGCSAFAVDGRLYVSTIRGNLQRLSSAGDAWEHVAKLERERFFHRMLPVGENQLLMVGGASMSVGKFAEVDIIAAP